MGDKFRKLLLCSLLSSNETPAKSRSVLSEIVLAQMKAQAFLCYLKIYLDNLKQQQLKQQQVIAREDGPSAHRAVNHGDYDITVTYIYVNASVKPIGSWFAPGSHGDTDMVFTMRLVLVLMPVQTVIFCFRCRGYQAEISLQKCVLTL